MENIDLLLERIAEKLTHFPSDRKDEVAKDFQELQYYIDRQKEEKNRCSQSIDELRASLNALALSEAKYREITESIQDGLIVINKNWQIIFINPRAAHNGGCDPEELIGRDIWEAFPSLLGTPIEDKYRQVMTEKIPVKFEMDGVYQDLWYNINIYPTKEGISVFWQDISERKRHEKAIEKSQQRLDSFLESTQEHIYALDQEWNYIFANRRYCEHRGIDLGSLIGNNFWAVNSRYLSTEIEAQIRKAMEERIPVRFRAGGMYTPYWFDVSIYPTSEGISVFSKDRTEEFRAEQALKESEGRFRDLANSISQLVWMANKEGWIFWYNQRWFEYTGTTLNEMEGWGWQKVHHPDYIDQVTEKFRGHIQSGQDWEDTFPLRGKDGQYRWFLSRAIPIKDENGDVVRWFGTNTDITERKNMEEALRLNENLVEAFFANSPGILNIDDEELRYLKTDPLTPTYFGLDRQSIVGKYVKDLAPEFNEQFGPMLKRVIETGQPEIREVMSPVTGREGEIAYWQASYFPVPLPGDKTGLGVIGVETTGLKKAEQQLQLANAQLSFFIDSNLVGVVIDNEEGKLIEVNDYYLNLLGYTREEFNAGVIDWRKITPPEYIPMDEKAIAEMKEHGICDPYEKEYYRKDGSKVWVYLRDALLPNGHLGAIVLDITKRKRVEEALKISDERFRIALKNSPLVVYTTDHNLRYTWIYNPALGFDPAQINGKTDEELNNPENVVELVELKRSVLESGAGKRQEIKFVYQGEEYFHDATVEPVRDENGIITGLTVVGVDITDKKRLEQARLQDQIQIEMQRRLIGQREQERQSIARDIHDGPIQTLVSTMFNLQMTKEAMDSPTLQGELNQVGLSIKQAIQELRDVVNELRPPTLQRFGLFRTIAMHVQDFNEKHPDLKIDYRAEEDQRRLPDEICLTLFRIYQEAMNNIVRHSEATTASVRFSFKGETVVLEISDNGKGFEVLPDFLGQTAKGHYGMAGMKERAEAIGGSFRVISSQGKGTLVKVIIPKFEK